MSSLTLLLACSSKTDKETLIQRSVEEVITSEPMEYQLDSSLVEELLALDSMEDNPYPHGYGYWYATQTLVPEDKVTKFDKLFEIGQKLSTQTKHYRDSLLNAVDINNLTLKLPDRDLSALLRSAIKDGNIYDYSELVVCQPIMLKCKYNLFMAEKYNFVPAYDHFFHCSYRQSRSKHKRREVESYFTLDSLSNNQRNLALYSLIQSYNKGFIENARVLADYFRGGVYFPKDIKMANSLDSVYESRNLLREN